MHLNYAIQDIERLKGLKFKILSLGNTVRERKQFLYSFDLNYLKFGLNYLKTLYLKLLLLDSFCLELSKWIYLIFHLIFFNFNIRWMFIREMF